jgi:hypothetical protein
VGGRPVQLLLAPLLRTRGAGGASQSQAIFESNDERVIANAYRVGMRVGRAREKGFDLH